VIGVKRELALQAMITKMPIKFEPSGEDPWLNAVLIRASEPLRADSIEQILLPAPGVS
jgi:calcineurin-like phosphoesterase